MTRSRSPVPHDRPPRRGLPPTGREILALAGVLAVAASLRLWAFGGVTAAHLGDDTRYVAVAQNLANGFPPAGRAEWFGGRIVFLWPVAGAFRLTGASDYSAVAWPFVMSLIAVLGAHLVGREIGGRRVGLTAASLVACAPLEVLMATRLRPDAVMPALVALAVWAALRARRARRPTAWGVAAGLLIVAAFSAREMAVVLIPVVVAAAWPAPRRTLAAITGGAVAGVAGLVTAAALAGADPLLPLTGAAGAGAARDPFAALSWSGSYAHWLWSGVMNVRHPAAGLLPLAAAAVATLIAVRDRRALLPAGWALWAYLYLEGPALASLSPTPRFLLTASIPVAVLLALAVARWTAAGPAAAVALTATVAIVALQDVPGRDHRSQDVIALNRAVAAARTAGVERVLAEDHTWWTKATLYLARHRLPVPIADDPRFLDAAARGRRSRLEPPPEVAAYRGEAVISGPVTPRTGWPRNWGAIRHTIRAEVPWDRLVPVARVGEAVVYRWPASVPARTPRTAGTGPDR